MFLISEFIDGLETDYFPVNFFFIVTQKQKCTALKQSTIISCEVIFNVIYRVQLHNSCCCCAVVEFNVVKHLWFSVLEISSIKPPWGGKIIGYTELYPLINHLSCVIKSCLTWSLIGLGWGVTLGIKCLASGICSYMRLHCTTGILISPRYADTFCWPH